MKQVIQNLRSGKTSLVEVPIPTPGPGMALIQTAASLVSIGTERSLVEFAGKSMLGKARSRPDLVRQTLDKLRREGVISTLEAITQRLDQPLLLGYSSAGRVIAVGEGTRKVKVGDRVACAGGGYAVHAEFAVVPENLMTHLPDSVDFETGAFTTLGAIALHGFRLAQIQVGETVAVIGLGLLGQLTVQLALAGGCKVLGVDLEEPRVDLAGTFGAEAVLRAEALEAADYITKGKGFDAVLICADTPSNDPVQLAGEIARDRGSVVAVGAVGLEIPRNLYFQKELSLLISRSYGPGRYDPTYEEMGQDYPIGYVRWTEGRNLAAIVELMEVGRLNVQPLITHRFLIDQALEAYELITKPEGSSPLGVIISYPGSPGKETEESRLIRFREPALQPSSHIRLGVLGAGNFAMAVMLPAMKHAKGVDFAGIATATGVKGEHAAKRYGFQYATTQEGQIYEDETINAIAILTRHHLHAQQVVSGLKSGKHVFCEKPLALNRDQLMQILEAMRDSDRLLMVGFNRRFAPASKRLKSFLSPLKDPCFMHYRINAGAIPSTHWVQDPAQGGGRIIGEACHFIDFLTFLTDSLPIRVKTVGLPEDDRFPEDNIHITITFADGSQGAISYLANGDRSFPKERLEVFCSGHIAVLDDFRTLEMISQGKHRTWRSRWKQDKGHRAEWEAFSDAILKGGFPPIPYSHLISVTMASIAAVESLRTQKSLQVDSPSLD
jgi:predicted dehydrogenase/threonine dehydrogenase-like Zn-dependent dehydrogenase